MDQFNKYFKVNQPHLAKMKMLVHQDKTMLQTSVVTTMKFKEMSFFSPNLSPSKYFLFSNLNVWLDGNRKP